MIRILKEIEKLEKQKEKLNDKRLNMNFSKNTQKQMSKVSYGITHICWYIDRLKTDFARVYTDSRYYTTTKEKEYNPTWFHKQKH